MRSISAPPTRNKSILYHCWNDDILLLSAPFTSFTFTFNNYTIGMLSKKTFRNVKPPKPTALPILTRTQRWTEIVYINCLFYWYHGLADIMAPIKGDITTVINYKAFLMKSLGEFVRHLNKQK